MNVYDFDGTLYPGDSTVDFWKYCVKRHPACLLALPGAVLSACAYLLHLCGKETLKERFYRFLRYVSDVDAAVEDFWDRRIGWIYPWYFNQWKADDLVISASPEFLVSAACRRLGVNFLASPVDAKTGCLLGPNCRGEEKVRRFRQRFGDTAIDEFYSDSRSDAPLARLAATAYVVKNGVPTPWERTK